MPKIDVKIDGDNSGAKSALDEIAGKAQSIGSSLVGVAGTVAKGTMAAIGVVTAAVAAIGKQSLDAYADYQQLVGGMKTLFGTGELSIEEYAERVGKGVDEVEDEYARLERAQTKILDNAARAYETTGMSANTYMETVTMFTGALRRSLEGDTELAAEYADKAMVQIADNVNKMGTDLEMAQNAYRGFARGNFMMLDNLALGYAGTRQGMQQLLEDAEKLSGVHYDIGNMADIIDAIGVIQDNLGITGTTAYEAVNTLQGSIRMLSASWENLLIGLADPDANLEELIGQLMESLGHALDNIIPTVKRIGDGIVNAIPEIIPQLTEFASTIINDLLTAAMNLLPEVGNAIITIMSSAVSLIVENLPMILAAIGELFSAIGSALVEMTPTVLDAIVEIITSLCTAITENLPAFLEAAATLFFAIASALIEISPTLIDTLVDVILTLIEVLPAQIPTLIASAAQFFMAILTALWNRAGDILDGLAQLIGFLIGLVVGAVADMIAAGLQFIGGLLKGTEDGSSRLKDFFRNLPRNLIGALGDIVGTFFSVGGNIIQGIINGVTASASRLVQSVISTASSALDGVLSFLGIASPSKVFRDRVGRWITLGVAEGVEDEKDALDLAMERTFTVDAALQDFNLGTVDIDSSWNDPSTAIVSWLELRLGPTLQKYLPDPGDTYNLPEGIYADSQIANALDMLGQAINVSMRMEVA